MIRHAILAGLVVAATASASDEIVRGVGVVLTRDEQPKAHEAALVDIADQVLGAGAVGLLRAPAKADLLRSIDAVAQETSWGVRGNRVFLTVEAREADARDVALHALGKRVARALGAHRLRIVAESMLDGRGSNDVNELLHDCFSESLVNAGIVPLSRNAPEPADAWTLRVRVSIVRKLFANDSAQRENGYVGRLHVVSARVSLEDEKHELVLAFALDSNPEKREEREATVVRLHEPWFKGENEAVTAYANAIGRRAAIAFLAHAASELRAGKKFY